MIAGRMRRRRGVPIGDLFADRARDLVALTGRDRYPSGPLVRLTPATATIPDVRGAARLLRAVAGAYRVPSRLISSGDDLQRVRVLASSWRGVVQQWTDAALRLAATGELSKAAEVINQCSTSVEEYFALQRDTVANGPRTGFWEAFGSIVQNTTDGITATIERAEEAVESAAAGAGFGLVVLIGVGGYLYLRGRK